MKTFIAIVEQCPETGLYVGFVPAFPDADLQAETLDELYQELHEVVDMLLEEGHTVIKRKITVLQTVLVA